MAARACEHHRECRTRARGRTPFGSAGSTCAAISVLNWYLWSRWWCSWQSRQVRRSQVSQKSASRSCGCSRQNMSCEPRASPAAAASSASASSLDLMVWSLVIFSLQAWGSSPTGASAGGAPASSAALVPLVRVHAIVANELRAVDAVAGGGLGVLAAVALLLAAAAAAAWHKARHKVTIARCDHETVRFVYTVVTGLLERLLLHDEALVDHVGHLTLQPARRARDGDALRTCAQDTPRLLADSPGRAVARIGTHPESPCRWPASLPPWR